MAGERGERRLHAMAQQTRHQLQAKRLAGTAGSLFKEGKLEQAAESFTEALELLDDGDSEQNIKVRRPLPAASGEAPDRRPSPRRSGRGSCSTARRC